MAWTPPSKFTVFLTFLLMAFAVFIPLDQYHLIWNPPLLPIIHITPTLSSPESWFIIQMIVIFLSWFFFFLGVKLKGL